MRTRPLLTSPALWIGAAVTAVALAFGCSSSSSPGSPGPTNDGGHDAGPTTDGGSMPDVSQADVFRADGAHDGGAPDALYGACALTGGFGWPCSAAKSGADPTDCTDPNYPQCFVGGQAAWCTKTCTSVTDCTTGLEDAGCVPTACNGQHFCK
jgi:hypothetical protein